MHSVQSLICQGEGPSGPSDPPARMWPHLGDTASNTCVEKPQQFHPWETAVITWDRWVHPCVFAFFLKLVIREGVTCFQLTASKALLQESSLHVRTFSRSEVLLGMGRVGEGVVLPSECVSHALRKHSHKPGGTGTLLRWLHQVLHVRISPKQPLLYVFLYLDSLVLHWGGFSCRFFKLCSLHLVLWLERACQAPWYHGSWSASGYFWHFRAMVAPYSWRGQLQGTSYCTASTTCSSPT